MVYVNSVLNIGVLNSCELMFIVFIQKLKRWVGFANRIAVRGAYPWAGIINVVQTLFFYIHSGDW